MKGLVSLIVQIDPRLQRHVHDFVHIGVGRKVLTAVGRENELLGRRAFAVVIFREAGVAIRGASTAPAAASPAASTASAHSATHALPQCGRLAQQPCAHAKADQNRSNMHKVGGSLHGRCPGLLSTQMGLISGLSGSLLTSGGRFRVRY